MKKKETSAKAPKAENTSRADSGWHGPWISSRTANIFYFSLLVLMLVSGFLAGRMTAKPSPEYPGARGNPGAIKARPGPWGNLEITPIIITAPVELLKVRGIEESPVKWLFKGYRRADLARLFDGLGIPADQQEKLLAPNSLSQAATGLEMIPSQALLVSLKTSALAGIYRVLADFPENDTYRDVFLSEDIEVFQKSGISGSTVSLIKSLSSFSGKYMICYCMPYVLAAIPTYEEKAKVLDAFTRQKSMLIKLRITPNSDVNALANYWGKAFWAANVSTLLKSVEERPDGGLISIVSLLPPVPKLLIYTYPMPQNGLNGPVVHQDCHWTSFNFFRDPPDSHFGLSEPGYIFDKLKTDYYPLQSDPLYGDVILIAKPDGSIIHSMVYIADDIVFTKNGSNLWHPWMYSKLSDVMDIYSANLAPGQNLTLRYFRNKYY